MEYARLANILNALLFGERYVETGAMDLANLNLLLPYVENGRMNEAGCFVVQSLAAALPPHEFGQVVEFLARHENLPLTQRGVSKISYPSKSKLISSYLRYDLLEHALAGVLGRLSCSWR